MFDPIELNRVQTLCREIYRTNGEGRAAASSIDYNRNQFSEAQLAGSTACRRLARAIYVVQTAPKGRSWPSNRREIRGFCRARFRSPTDNRQRLAFR